MIRLQSLVCLVLVSAGLLVGPLVAPAAASASGTYESSVIKNSNAERHARDLVSVKTSTCLDRYAERQARAMARKHTMYHQKLGPILKKCKLSQVGENVAVGYPTGQAVTRAWMDSSGHRANLLNPRHRLIGVGAYQDSRGWWYVAQVLGRAR